MFWFSLFVVVSLLCAQLLSFWFCFGFGLWFGFVWLRLGNAFSMLVVAAFWLVLHYFTTVVQCRLIVDESQKNEIFSLTFNKTVILKSMKTRNLLLKTHFKDSLLNYQKFFFHQTNQLYSCLGFSYGYCNCLGLSSPNDVEVDGLPGKCMLFEIGE